MPIMFSLRKIFNDRLYRYYIVMAFALIATGVIGRLNAFSGPNVYVPSYLGVALLVGLEAGWLIELKIHPALDSPRVDFISGAIWLSDPRLFSNENDSKSTRSCGRRRAGRQNKKL